MNIYAFDIDDTLWFSPSPGPITFEMIVKLREEGHITGLLGQWAHTRVLDKEPRWKDIFSFVGMVPWSNDKRVFMEEFKKYVTADKYIMVGNKGRDDIEAISAGWYFISEDDFAGGER